MLFHASLASFVFGACVLFGIGALVGVAAGFSVSMKISFTDALLGGMSFVTAATLITLAFINDLLTPTEPEKLAFIAAVATSAIAPMSRHALRTPRK